MTFAFQLYDIDGDHYVSFDELVQYLSSVFKVLFITSPGRLNVPHIRPSRSHCGLLQA